MSYTYRKFRTKREQLLFENSFNGKYLKLIKKNPFLYFGIPFCSMVVLGSYWLTNFLGVKYEREDRRIQEISEEDLLKLKRNQRKFDIKEEYYRLQGLDEQDWEQVRIERLKDESENVW